MARASNRVSSSGLAARLGHGRVIGAGDGRTGAWRQSSTIDDSGDAEPDDPAPAGGGCPVRARLGGARDRDAPQPADAFDHQGRGRGAALCAAGVAGEFRVPAPILAVGRARQLAEQAVVRGGDDVLAVVGGEGVEGDDLVHARPLAGRLDPGQGQVRGDGAEIGEGDLQPRGVVAERRASATAALPFAGAVSLRISTASAIRSINRPAPTCDGAGRRGPGRYRIVIVTVSISPVNAKGAW
ncbi:hypothetical protein [uncultured Albimonas sp.]|uniref:hypothetical protein n=1 Tax=uncultured Albimonas sp. TaxID=1331701 RepID=UPI0030ED5059|tara:strand:- start:4583 stop:5305 length:723 start_codon:yes stop_codon:yes gene_type:complete